MAPHRFRAGDMVEIKGKEVALPLFTLRCHDDAEHNTPLSFLVETDVTVLAEQRH